MIFFCSFCGDKLQTPIKSGLISCNKCSRICDSTCRKHILLSAIWLVKKWNLLDKDSVKEKCNLTEDESNIVHFYTIKNDYSYDDIIKILK